MMHPIERLDPIRVQLLISSEFQAQYSFTRLLMNLLFGQFKTILGIKIPTNRILFKNFYLQVAMKLLRLIHHQLSHFLALVLRLKEYGANLIADQCDESNNLIIDSYNPRISLGQK